ncbi:hypothetical protein DYBT9275_05248 [Dyadobacter sp. CECT 9275]|uniref:Lipid/polyisoprenoid-binding YceI-like domain-containing protein n=2 Tax=Dyadobacter helix TaxID=2822344 RepID=A0A916JI28_9BACT|nr:hypothetical protein DYBT9275_05248 [Dyadobacter sp. CECT 9275]
MKSISVLISLLLVCSCGKSFGQASSVLFATSSGETRFSSDTPLENILAVNKKTQVILNTVKNEIAVRMNIREFVFPNKLMQEHFNENYMDSDKFPVATFSGTLDSAPDFSKDGQYDISATGNFTLRGVTKKRTLKGLMKVTGGTISIASEFEVALEDHKIEVPQVVFVKIAQVIKVKANYTLVPYKK